MMTSFDIWKVLAGVAIFLLGIKFLEESLQQLVGRKFKLFLKKQTSNKLKAIGGGAIVTGILQSSSLVSLMVLAFVGAGVISMQNALAVILGANFGTTLDSWIVALVGFKVNIERIALPIAGIAGLGYASFNKQTKWYNLSRFFLGFSFLFVGLGYMKTGIEDLVKGIDFRNFEQSPVIIFFLIGLLITSLIQSSSATIAITLSALYAGAVNLIDSMAIILGSEIGTTMKLFIASFKGLAAKKRVALGNFLFNSISVVLALLFLMPINNFIVYTIGIKDNLIALVFFQSFINVLGIILFFPLLNVFGRFLEKRFKSTDDETLFIHKVAATETSTALFALENETRHFFLVVSDFALHCFEIKNTRIKEKELGEKFIGNSLAEKYEHIKYLHGEIHSFYINLQKIADEKDDIEKLNRLISSVRNTMYAAKNVKDAINDIIQLSRSSNDTKYNFYLQIRNSIQVFFDRIFLLQDSDNIDHSGELVSIYKIITDEYTTTLQQLYREGTAGQVSETEITTMLNFNREIFTAYKSLFFGVKDYLLNKDQSKYFDELPGFIR